MAHAKLLERVKARDLTMAEWRDFLYDMSQTDVIKYLGNPDSQTDTWTYNGNWTEDPTTHQKVGLQITFQGGRVLFVLGVPLPITVKLPEAQ